MVDYLAAHVRVRQALAHGLTPDEDEARILTASDDDTARLGATLQLAEGLLTSRGESGQGRTAVSDATQAVVAAAWRVHGSRLLGRRPAVLDDWLSGLEHQHDPVTILASMATTYGIDHEYIYDVSGPDHLKSFTATIGLRDCTSGSASTKWTSRQPAKFSPACCPTPFRTPTAWSVTTMYCCACTASSRRFPSIPWPQRAWTPTSPGRWTSGGPLKTSPPDP